MKIVSLFNNKGGVGKSTLGYHLGCALGEMGKKVLLVDLDPQCNLTICGIPEDDLHKIWSEEDDFIDDFATASKKSSELDKVLGSTRSIHFLLKPTEDGVTELEHFPQPKNIAVNVDLIPGRLSLHKYENKLAERWSAAYQGDNLSIRTITNIRRICEEYGAINNYDFVIIDTSPSLGTLNKTIISTVDGFFIPALPDMFSLYGIRNIGSSLEQWKMEFETLYRLISDGKRKKFPNKFVQFMGFTIYNAKKRSSGSNPYDLANAHYSYVVEMPRMVESFISVGNRIDFEKISEPIGGTAVMHTHNTFPSVSQALRCPMWKVPEAYRSLESQGPDALKGIYTEKPHPGHYSAYGDTKEKYIEFAREFILRTEVL